MNELIAAAVRYHHLPLAAFVPKAHTPYLTPHTLIQLLLSPKCLPLPLGLNFGFAGGGI
jgi:hypothetical protein